MLLSNNCLHGFVAVAHSVGEKQEQSIDVGDTDGGSKWILQVTFWFCESLWPPLPLEVNLKLRKAISTFGKVDNCWTANRLSKHLPAGSKEWMG